MRSLTDAGEFNVGKVEGSEVGEGDEDDDEVEENNRLNEGRARAGKLSAHLPQRMEGA
jgi:hypothetical protein